MNETNPPIPPPTPYSCSHCGFGFDAPREFCPQCGTKLKAPGGAKSWLTILGIIALGLLAFPLALAGACFLLLGGSEYGPGAPSMYVYGALGLGFAALCIWGIVKLSKR